MWLWNNFTRSIPEFQVMYSKKRSNSSSAPTSFRTTIFPPAMSVNFPTPICLHSSCRYQTSVDSRCHLPLATNTITPGHFVMERQSTPLNKYSWKARSDLQTGLKANWHNCASNLETQRVNHPPRARRVPQPQVLLQHPSMQLSCGILKVQHLQHHLASILPLCLSPPPPSIRGLLKTCHQLLQYEPSTNG